MILNLMSDINTYISFSNNNSNNDFSVIRGYNNINWVVSGTTSQEYIKIHLLNIYSIDNLVLNLSIYDFASCNLFVSNDNINWTLVDSSSNSSKITFNFNKKYDCSFIKIEFNSVNNIILDDIEIELDDSSSIFDYNDFFKKIKKDEMNSFLPEKIFKDSDITNIFKKYLEL